MSKIIKLFLVLFGVLIIAPALALAQSGSQTSGSQTAGGPINNTTATQSLPNPLSSISSPNALIRQVITSALGVVGSLALVMFIYGGFTWMLSAGNDKSIEKGKATLTWAALGLVIIFLSYVIINFIFSVLKVSS